MISLVILWLIFGFFLWQNTTTNSEELVESTPSVVWGREKWKKRVKFFCFGDYAKLSHNYNCTCVVFVALAATFNSFAHITDFQKSFMMVLVLATGVLTHRYDCKVPSRSEASVCNRIYSLCLCALWNFIPGIFVSTIFFFQSLLIFLTQCFHLKTLAASANSWCNVHHCWDVCSVCLPIREQIYTSNIFAAHLLYCHSSHLIFRNAFRLIHFMSSKENATLAKLFKIPFSVSIRCANL